MSPISEVTLPDPRKGSRKFDAQEGVAARDLLTQGKQASDGELYDKETGARSAGDSLKRAVLDAEGGAALRIGIRVVPDGQGFVFALVPRSEEEDAAEDAGVDPDKHTRAELDKIAADEGVTLTDADKASKTSVAKAIDAHRAANPQPAAA